MAGPNRLSPMASHPENLITEDQKAWVINSKGDLCCFSYALKVVHALTITHTFQRTPLLRNTPSPSLYVLCP